MCHLQFRFVLMYSFVLVIERRAEMVHLRSTLHCTALYTKPQIGHHLENKYKSSTSILAPDKWLEKVGD